MLRIASAPPLLGVATALLLAVVAFAVPLHRSRKTRLFGLLNVFTAAWMAGYFLELNVGLWSAEGWLSGESVLYAGFAVEAIARAGTALLWFLFAAEVAVETRYTRGRALLAQGITAAVIGVLTATSPLHHLVYRDFFVLGVTHAPGPLQPLADLVQYAWGVAAIVMFATAVRRTRVRAFWKMGPAVVCAGVLVLFGSLTLSFGGAFSLELPIDPGVMVMPLLNVVVGYTVFRSGLAEILPLTGASAFEVLSDGVVLTDESCSVLASNLAAQRLLPMLKTGGSLRDALEDSGVDPEAVECDPARGGDGELEATIGSSRVWVRATATQGEGLLGSGRLVVLTDISQLRATQNQLTRANAELLEAQRARDGFMRGLGRDLRSPLSTLVGLADVLVTGMPGPLNEEQESQLRVIRDSGRDVLALVDRLIEHAKGENRLVSLRAEETDLCETVRDVVHSMRPAAARRGLALTLSLDCPECRTVTNGRAVRQILENLISNAVKNTDRGAVGVLLSLQNGRACIEVMDTGRGIDKARIEEIFDHDGERVDDVLDSDPGTHISLGVCRDLAWHLGGDITVRSVPKAGSRFRLLLPRLSPAKV